MKTDKVNTLYFVLQGNNLVHSYEEIMSMICTQRSNFFDTFGYYPDCINIEEGLYVYLSCRMKEMVSTDIGELNAIYGMVVKTRENRNKYALSEYEAICL